MSQRNSASNRDEWSRSEAAAERLHRDVGRRVLRDFPGLPVALPGAQSVGEFPLVEAGVWRGHIVPVSDRICWSCHPRPDSCSFRTPLYGAMLSVRRGSTPDRSRRPNQQPLPTPPRTGLGFFLPWLRSVGMLTHANYLAATLCDDPAGCRPARQDGRLAAYEMSGDRSSPSGTSDAVGFPDGRWFPGTGAFGCWARMGGSRSPPAGGLAASRIFRRFVRKDALVSSDQIPPDDASESSSLPEDEAGQGGGNGA